MKLRLWLLSVTLLMLYLSFGTVAHSAMTGADFMQSPPSSQSGFINGFVRVMYATCLDHLEVKKEICSSGPVLDATFDMTPEQVLDLFLTYIRKNPERQPARLLLVRVDRLLSPAFE